MIPISDKEKNIPETEETVPTEEIIEETAEVSEETTEETAAAEESKEETQEAAAENVQDAQPEEKKEDKKKKKKDKKSSEYDALSDDYLKKCQDYDILNDKYLRACAEYDNYRKRTQKEKDALYGDIKCNVVTSFLPVYDNLVRALETKTEDEAFKKGVEMIMDQFKQTLDKLGVTEIPALGEKFDPEIHNAVMHVDDEEKGENEVVEVFQKGFRLGDKIIRFAMVKVAN